MKREQAVAKPDGSRDGHPTKSLLKLLIGLLAVFGSSSPAQHAPQTSGKAGSPIEVEAHKSRLKRVHVDLSGFALPPKPSNKDASVQIGAGTRGATPRVFLCAPLRAKSYTIRPTFYWGGAERHDFALTVYDSNGSPLYDVTTRTNSVTYPADAPTLKPGAEYSWTVQLVDALIPQAAEAVEFELVSLGDRKAIDQALKRIDGDSLQEQVRRAEIFVEARLWYDSVEAYSALIAKFPEHPELYDRRGEIYDQIPVTRNLADEDFKRAEQLRQQLQPK
jgi:uncharacterized protein DUF928